MKKEERHMYISLSTDIRGSQINQLGLLHFLNQMPH